VNYHTILNSNTAASEVVVVTLVLDEVDIMVMTDCVGDSIKRRLKVDCDAVRVRRVETDLSPL